MGSEKQIKQSRGNESEQDRHACKQPEALDKQHTLELATASSFQIILYLARICRAKAAEPSWDFMLTGG